MRNNNNPGRAIDFANIKSGDIIIADTFTTEDTFFHEWNRKRRYALYTVETCNKVDKAILSPLTSYRERSALTKDGDTCTIKTINGDHLPIVTDKVRHYTYPEAVALRLHERINTEESLRYFISYPYDNFMPHQVEREMEEIYARHTGEQGHDATSILDLNTSREVMTRIVEDGIKVARQLLDEDFSNIDENIMDALIAYKEIKDIMETHMAPPSVNSESLTVTDEFTYYGYTESGSYTFTTGTAITVDDTDYLITRLADNKAYVVVAGETEEAGYLTYTVKNKVSLHLKDSEPIPFVSLEEIYQATTLEDIENYHKATEKVTEIFNTLEESLSKLWGQVLNYPVRDRNPIRDVGRYDYGRKTPNEALMLAGMRVTQLKTGRATLSVLVDNCINTIKHYTNQAYGEF